MITDETIAELLETLVAAFPFLERDSRVLFD